MLLKTRREFTLCFFLFAPLGMAGYCAGVQPADTPVQSAKSKSTESKSRTAAKKGGQPAPQSPGGGLSSAEQLSRLLVDGRRAFRDGEIMTARSYFRDALKLDDGNEEAQRFLKEIEQKSSGARFSPDGLSAQIPAGVAGRADKVDVKATIEAVKANAAPGPVTQNLGGKEQVSVSNSVSVSLGSNSNSFSKPVSVAVSLNGSGSVSKSPSDAAGTNVPKLISTGGSASTRELLSESSLAVTEDQPKAEVASADEPAVKASSKLNLDVDLTAKADKAKAEQATAKKAADDKAAAEKVEKMAAEKSEREKAERQVKDEADRKEAARVAKEVAEEQKAQRAAMEKTAKEKAAKDKAEADEKAKVEAARAEKELADKKAAEKAEKEKADKELAEKKAAEKAEREKAEKELADQKAAEKVEREKAEKEIAARKSEDAKKAAEDAKKAEEERELAEKKKAEEAKKIADAELAAKEAKEAAEKAEKEQRIVQAKAEKEQFSKAVSETNAGIKLYNAGKYDDARKKFELALVTQPDYREAKSYLERSERKITAAAEKAEAKTDAPALNLDQLKDNMKEVAQATSKAAVAKTESTETVTTSVVAEVKSDALPAASADAKQSDPIVEADKLLREAQTSLAEGKRDQALESARKATELDPKNVSASALVKELTTEGAKSLPSLSEATAAASDAKAAVTVETDAVAESTSLDVAAPEPVSPPVIGDGPSGVSSLLTEGRSKFESGQLREAQTTFKAVLDVDAENAEAKTYLRKIEVARAGEGGPVPAPSVPGGPAGGTAQTAQDAEAAFQQGLVAYQAGRLDVAVQHWNFSLTLDPNHPRSVQYLEQTRSEYEAWVQQHQYNAIELQQEVAATNKLETPVTYDSAGQKTLVEYLQAMSLITDISFYVADGVDADLRITAKFDQTVLQDALDIVLLPVGLKWHRTGDVVTITTDLHNKFYNLTPDQVARLKPLLENRTLQRYLYGPEGVPPMRNVELLLDDRENMLVVTDSVENLNKIEAFLKDLQVDAPQQLVFKNWKVRPEEAQRIKALVEAIVKVNSDAAWDLDRRVVVDGDDLIVKDTADNVAKIEQLLLDKNFLAKLEDQTLNVQNYSLIPREPIGPENVEQARDMAQSVVTVVKTILYSQSGEEAAAAEGRRFWYDPNTLQLTITDFPNNLEIVSDYLKSLPTLSSSEEKSEIIWLKHQTATEMKGLLDQVLGLSAGSGISGGGSPGQFVTKTVRTEGELVFGDLHIRVRRVEANDADDDTDDSAEMIVRTATSSQDLTLEEYQTEFVDEYEITAEDVRPSDTNDGEGSVRLRVGISAGGVVGAGFGPGLGVGGFPGGVGGFPGGVGGLGIVPATPAGSIPGAITASLQEELGIIIETVPSMNALLIRYSNPADIDEVKRWLKELDVPVLQVSIETKLVEVNETRAKEFMPEFNWANIGQGTPDFSEGTNFFDFAKNDFVGELGRSPFDPFAEDAFNSGLLKGTSVFNIISGGESPISFTLRALESEGVVNLTNGPMITVENGEAAEFNISRDFGLVSTQLGGNNQSNRSVPRINHVNMNVTPQITQAGEIRLEIQDLELNDFGNQIGNIFPIQISQDNDQQNDDGVPVGPIVGNVPYEVRRRGITTVARVKNHGTIVLGGWTGERSRTNDSGVPILRNLPYVGKLLFGRTSDKIDRTNLLIFLTCHLVDP